MKRVSENLPTSVQASRSCAGLVDVHECRGGAGLLEPLGQLAEIAADVFVGELAVGLQTGATALAVASSFVNNNTRRVAMGTLRQCTSTQNSVVARDARRVTAPGAMSLIGRSFADAAPRPALGVS